MMQLMSEKVLPARAPAGAIDRALAVLDVLAAADDPLGVSEIARRLGLPKSVVHYHLMALLRNRYVAVNGGRQYELGPSALRLGNGSVTHRRPDLRTRALPYLHRVQAETWETVTLSQLIGTQRVFLDQVVSPREIKLAVELNRPFPLYAGAAGKALLAFLPASRREELLGSRLERLTPNTMVDPTALRKDLERIRQTGVAVSRGERLDGSAAVAAPLFDARGVTGSICVCGPVYRFIDAALERFKLPVRAAAAALSRELGGVGVVVSELEMGLGACPRLAADAQPGGGRLSSRAASASTTDTATASSRLRPSAASSTATATISALTASEIP
jgi:IclR family acetate operon transcriptional repressor